MDTKEETVRLAGIERALLEEGNIFRGRDSLPCSYFSNRLPSSEMSKMRMGPTGGFTSLLKDGYKQYSGLVSTP